MANISVLLELLNVDCYPLRSAIVDSIGSLLSAEGRPLPKGARCALKAAAVANEEGETAEGEAPADNSASGVDSQGGRAVQGRAARDQAPACTAVEQGRRGRRRGVRVREIRRGALGGPRC